MVQVFLREHILRRVTNTKNDDCASVDRVYDSMSCSPTKSEEELVNALLEQVTFLREWVPLWTGSQ
jgi:hypothetical protein